MNGISCEVYKLQENKWNLLPNIPPSKTLKMSTNRRPPAVFVEGNLYAALPSPKPSFWVSSYFHITFYFLWRNLMGNLHVNCILRKMSV